MTKFKLKRPIKDALGEKDIVEIKVREEKELTADDFLDVVAIPSGQNVKETVCNMTGLTSEQVGSMHPSDYNKLAGLVGKCLGEF